MRRLRDRSTGDLLVLMIALTVCGYIVVISCVLIVNVIVNPDAEETGAARNIADIINTLIGLLAGYLAGKSGSKPDETPLPGPQDPPGVPGRGGGDGGAGDAGDRRRADPDGRRPGAPGDYDVND